MGKLVECVPNFSEGRDLEKIHHITKPFLTTEGVKLLDYSNDKDHNRTVVTAMGEPQAMRRAVVAAVGAALSVIDLNTHKGEHPRMGAADVVPFIPIRDMDMAEAIQLAKETAQELAETYGLPIYLYEKAASSAERENLANIRKGEYEGLAEKMKNPIWKPDFGPSSPHATGGATVVGARMPLIAYNINLGTKDIEVANAIARCIRHISGGFRYCKAMGIDLSEKGIVQVSINMTDFTKTALYRVFETVKFEAQRYGVPVLGSEIVGLTPMAALVDTASYYLGLHGFTTQQVIESRLLDG